MTFLEIRQRIAEMLDLDVSDTFTDPNGTVESKLKEWVNTRYRVLAGKRSWNWLIKDSILQTVTEVTTGTVSIANASASITFSSGPALSATGWFIRFGSDESWYEVSGHTAGQTAATLTTPYLGTTDAAATYVLRKVYYTLPSDCGKLLDMRQTESDAKVRYVPYRLLDRYVPDRTASGTPAFYTITGLTSARLYKVELYPVPDQAINLQLRYQHTVAEMSADADVPLIPEAFHDYLVWDVLSTYGYMFLDDTRMVQAKDVRKNIYEDMVANDVDAENVVSRAAFDVDLGERNWLSQLNLPVEP